MKSHEQEIQDILHTAFEQGHTNGRVILMDNPVITVGNRKIHPIRKGLKPTPSQMKVFRDAILDPEKVKGTVSISDGKEIQYKVKAGEVVTPWRDKTLTAEQQAEWDKNYNATKPQEPEVDLKQKYTDLLNKSFKDNGLETTATYSEMKDIAKRSPSLGRDFDTQVVAAAKTSGIDSKTIDKILTASPLKEASIETVKQHLEKMRTTQPEYGFKEVMNKNKAAIAENAKSLIAKAATAQKNLELLGEKAKSFSLKDWAQTQSKSLMSKTGQFVSKQVENVKNWAFSQYPKIRSAVLDRVKGLDDRMMAAANKAQSVSNAKPQNIEQAAKTILYLANGGQPEKGFSNDKIAISTGAQGISIESHGKPVYANGRITPEATAEDKALLGKLPGKAHEMSIKASQDVSMAKGQMAEVER
jgi:hypothetical protein